MRKISVVITFYNSFKYLEDAIRIPLFDNRVSEIIILDDYSDIGQYNLLKNKIKSFLNGEKISNDINCNFINTKYFNYKANIEYLTKKVVSKLAKKIFVYRNNKNLGPFISKYLAVKKSNNDWVYLLDGDNFLIDSSIGAIFNLKKWDKKVCYLPSTLITNMNKKNTHWDHWNFRRFCNQKIDLKEIQRLFNLEDSLLIKNNAGIGLNGLLNIGNFFINKKKYLNCLKKPLKEKIKPEAADAAAFLYYWLINKNEIKIVPELYYFHRIREDSFWQTKNKNSYYERLKIKILKFINPVKNDMIGSTSKLTPFNKAIYYEAMIRNAKIF